MKLLDRSADHQIPCRAVMFGAGRASALARQKRRHGLLRLETLDQSIQGGSAHAQRSASVGGGRVGQSVRMALDQLAQNIFAPAGFFPKIVADLSRGAAIMPAKRI
jgi:hypothetical protein